MLNASCYQSQVGVPAPAIDFADAVRLGPALGHDFRTLLSVILGNAQLLADELRFRPELLPLVSDIIAAGDRAVVLSRQLDSLGTNSLAHLAEIDLREGVAAAGGVLRALAGSRIRLVLNLGAAVVCVRFDPVRLFQVLINLVSNARDAVSGHGEVRVELSSADGLACLAVSDDGHGIPPDLIPHIFEPYFTTKPASLGSGLGLATVNAFVRQAGGHLVAENLEDGGARFCVLLPLVGGAAPEECSLSGIASPTAGPRPWSE